MTPFHHHLEKLGFKRVPVDKAEQVVWMFSLDLEGKTEEQILKEMKPNTRNQIKKTELNIKDKIITLYKSTNFHSYST